MYNLLVWDYISSLSKIKLTYDKQYKTILLTYFTYFTYLLR